MNITQTVKNAYDYLKKHPILVTIALFALFYSIIRFGWQDSIEFGYDPARLSQMVSDIIDLHDLGNAPQYILDNINVGSVAWGPVFIYIMLPFFLVTRDPLVITNILIALQFLGIVALYLSVELLYNKRVAFFATMFTIAFPWHVYFSRMVYNPSMLLWSVPLVMYVTLLVVKKGKQKLLFVLPALWLVMIQFHFVGLVILVLSLGYIIVHYKKVTWRYFRFGLLVAIIPLLPILVFDVNHNWSFTKGVFAGNKNPVDPDNDPSEVVRTVADDTQKYMLLTDVDNHIGYASSDFFSRLPFVYKLIHPLYVVLFVASLLFYLFRILWKHKADDVLVLLWLFAVTVFLIVFNLKSSTNMIITQRYFLPSFFVIGIMIGRTLDTSLELLFGWIKKLRVRLDPGKAISISTYIASGVFVLSFGLFMMTYHTLIITYDYSQTGALGWLAPDSGPPYESSYKAISCALAEAKKEGFDTIVLSDNWEIGEGFHLPNHVEYTWKYVFKRDSVYNPALPFYFLCLGPPPERIPLGDIKRFGPWRLYRKAGLPSSDISSLTGTDLEHRVILVSVASEKCIQIENTGTGF